jgi:membrane-associated phospholipid phosphatase
MMKFRKRSALPLFVVMLLLLAFQIPAAATNGDFATQNDIGSSLSETGLTNEADILNSDYWKDYITDSGALCSAPFHWSISEWKTVGIVLGITTVLYKCDTQIMNWSQDNRTEITDSISRFTKPFGDSRVLVPLTVLYIYGCRAGDNRARKTAVLSLESFVISGFFGNSLKYVGHRSRPRTGASYDTWEGLSFNDDDGMSFPSGHTACAFSVATIVADEYRDHPAIPVISYSIATLTGLSRINDNAHWASDVFFGAAIGYFTSKSLLARHPDNKKTWTVRPMTDGTTVGLAVSYHF